MDTGVDEVHARQKSCLPDLRKQYSCPRFNASFCNPFQKDIIELGTISKDSILDKFENTPWAVGITGLSIHPNGKDIAFTTDKISFNETWVVKDVLSKKTLVARKEK